MAIERKRGLVGAGPGAVAGIVSGVVMAATAMVVSAAMGNGFWFPVHLIGASLYGVDAILGGMAPGITGLLLHLGVSACYGAIFGLMTRIASPGYSASGGGMLYGVAVWAVMTFAILPWLNPTMFERVALTPYWWFAYHLEFGVVLGAAPAIARAMRETEAETETQQGLRSAA
jgi:hypothetical protein